MKQRPNGASSIDLTPNGRFRVRFAFDSKKREAINDSPFATREAAEQALAVLVEQTTTRDMTPRRARCTGVYFLRVGDGPVKIGYGDDIDRRVAGIQTSHWQRVDLLAFVRGATKMEEALLHRRFAHARIRGEWFWPVQDLLDCIQSHRLQDDHRRRA